MKNDLIKAADLNLDKFVDEFIDMGEILYDILEKHSHKNVYGVKGKKVFINIHRRPHETSAVVVSNREEVINAEF